jgi:uncharacterized protein YggE
MKTYGRILSLILLIALFLAAGMAAKSGQAQTPTPTAQEGSVMRTISVTGTGQASAQPDVAVVRIGVTTEADTAQEALTQNNQQMQALLEALADSGIEQENIQTSFVQLQPRYNQPTGQEGGSLELAGYTAVNIVEVRVEDINRVGEVLDAAVSAGANTVEGIFFEISDPSGLYAQAMDGAMADARLKAEHLASLAGAELGEILSITEGAAGPIPFAAGGVSRLDSSVPVEPGTQNVTAQLQVTWELGPSGSAVIPGTGATQTATRPPATVTSTQPAATATLAPTREPASPSATATPTQEPAASTEPLNFRRLLRAIEALDEDVELAGEIRQPFFPVIGQLIRVGEAEVQVFQFSDPETRAAISDTLSGTGGLLDTIAATLGGQPDLWAQGRLIVLYAGQDQNVTELLSQVLGDPLTETRAPQGPPPLAALVAQDSLATRLGTGVEEVEILSYEQVEWPNTCLGLLRPGEACAEVLTPGWRIILEAEGRQYEAHTDLLAEAIRWRV